MSKRTLAELLNAGAVLSNLAYNIAQPEVTLDASVRQSAKRCLERWDDARRAHRVALATERKRKRPKLTPETSCGPVGRKRKGKRP